MSAVLTSLRRAGVLSALDEQLALRLGRLANESDERVLLAIALASRQLEQGHVCLPLAAVSSHELLAGEALAAASQPWPSLAQWRSALAASVLVGVEAEGQGEIATPLVLDAAGRLYLRRYFAYERGLAAQILTRLQRTIHVDDALLVAGLQRLFGPAGAEDLQRTAAQLAVRSAFTVISGGPGTGKTSTVVKILALIIEQALAQGQSAPRIALMAPTGKAAARLHEAIGQAMNSLSCSDAVRAALPQEASTIHRALSAVERPRSREIGQERALLPVDVLLVDEASMVDSELMARLVDAAPPQARLILLGDRHQLASVQAGAVLGDICGAGLSEPERARSPAMSQRVVQLTRSYRYAAQSGIGELARAINAGDAVAALEILDAPRHQDVALCEPSEREGLGAAFAAQVVAGFTPYLSQSDPERALACLDGFRVLCAHRRGPRGVDGVNRAIAELLHERGLIERADGVFWGRPILITHNDYRNGLWNGDIGLFWRTQRAEPLLACFASPRSGLRRLGTARLPAYESAFALSIHKSQGTEVDEVAVVLPEQGSAVVTREPLYTAVTRARNRVVIHASRALFTAAVLATVNRSSGLRDALYGAGS